MELNTLKRLRLIVPGVLIFIVFILFINKSFLELIEFYKALIKISLKDIIYLVVFIVLGVMYYSLGIRYRLWNPFLKRVQENIKETLLYPFKAEFTEVQISHLKTNRTLMNVFYEFVDNNESLKEKAKLVRFNGLIWTSCVDLTIIFFIGSLGCFVKYYFSLLNYDLLIAICLFLISFISFLLIFLLTNNHIKLSNSQLEVITELYRANLKTRLNELL